MKKLYATVLREDDGAHQPADPATIEAVEAQLGSALSRTYKAFASAVGAASWPVLIFGVEQLQIGRGFGQPDWFLAFADDGGGNSWGWDLRGPKRGEYPIVFWDHEEPPEAEELREPATTTSFDEWLDDMVRNELDEAAKDASEARWDRIGAALSEHNGTVFPYAPEPEDLRAVEVKIGRKLPLDYAAFTTRFGSTDWPFVIVDGQEIEALTSLMCAEHRELRGAVAFGRDRDGSYLAFRKDSVVGVGRRVAKSFLALLESRLFTVEKRSPEPQQVLAVNLVEVPAGITDERARDLYRACASSKSFAAEPVSDGRVQLRIDTREGGRRRSFVDAEEWASIARWLARRS